MAPQFDRPLRDLLRAAGCTMVGKAKAATKSGTAQSTKGTSPCPSESRAGTLRMRFCARPDCRKRSDATPLHGPHLVYAESRDQARPLRARQEALGGDGALYGRGLKRSLSCA